MSVLRKLWKFSAGLFAAVVILLALLIGLFRLLLPLAPEFHGQIEAAASRYLKATVTIERIDARWRLGGPELLVKGARIFDNAGEMLLEVGNGSVGISAMRWLRTRVVAPERLTLDGVTIDIARRQDGRIAVLGRPIGGEGSGNGKLPHGRFELTDATIIFRDLATPATPKVFSDVEINVEIDGAGMRLDGSVALPPELGKSLVLSAQFDGELADFSTLSWHAYLSGDQVLLSGWATFLPASQPWFEAGGGDIELWVGFRGERLEQASLRVDLAQLRVADPTADGSASYQRVSGRGEWNRSTSGWQASAHDVTIDRGERGWQASLIRAELARTDADATQVFYAVTDLARVDDLTPLANLALPGALRDRLVALAPAGELRDVEVRFSRRDNTLTSYFAQAQFTGIGAAATEKTPGVEGLSGDLRIDTAGGSLHLLNGPLRIDDPARFRQTLEFDEFGGTVVWRSTPDAVHVVSDSIVARNADLSANASIDIAIPAGDAAPVVDLRVDLTDIDLGNAKRYLPAPLMRPNLVNWLDNAIRAGRAPTARVELRGALDGFPFKDGDGSFRAWLDLQSVDLQFNGRWPTLAGIDGEIAFEGTALSAAVTSGTIAGNRIRTGQVRIADLREPVIEIDSTADGGIVPTLDFLRLSPVGEAMGDGLERLSGDGDGELKVRLTLPLADMDKRDVAVELSLDGARIAVEGFAQPVEQIRGQVSYGNDGLHGAGINASFLNRPVVIAVRPEARNQSAAGAPSATLVEMSGTFSASDLADGLLPPLRAVLDGQSQFTGVLRLPAPNSKENVTIDIASQLDGMALTLPAPLARPVGLTTASSARLTLVDAQLMDLDLSVGDAHALVELRDDGSSWHPYRGHVTLGGGVPERGNEPGIAVTGDVGDIDVGGWLSFDLGTENPRPLESTLRSIRLSATHLDLFGQSMRDATIAVDRSQREWLVQLDANEAEGVLFVPFVIDATHPVVANFNKLRIVGGDPKPDEPPQDPRKIPPAKIDVTDFRFDDMQLGVMHAEIASTPPGIRLDVFDVVAPSFHLTGKGDWSVTADRHRSGVDMQLVSTDLAATLKSLAFEASVAADQANLTMALTWPGPPDSRFRNQLAGEVSVDVGSGRLVSVQPGAGRVFGLLSVAALPRRLSLDFTDVFDSGFSFDFIRGDFSLRDGNAYTSNLVLDGPAAQVGIVGRAGIAARDYDQTAVVYANFGATLPVAGAVVGGPAIGAAMLLFSELFKRPLAEMARANYRITGSWDDPQVERVVATDHDRDSNASTQ